MRLQRVLVVDDEPHALHNLRYLVRREADVAECALCDGGAAAVAQIASQRPDLVFLDVQMPEVDGFEVVRRVGVENMPPVVFVTAHDAWAVRAFDVNAVDYLLKPVADERFAAAMRRARGRIDAREAAALSQRLAALLGNAPPSNASGSAPSAVTTRGDGPQPGRQLVLRDGGRSLVLDLDEIDWIAAEDYCVQIYAGERSHLIRLTLAAIGAKLDDPRFVRVHRSALVNLDRVREIRTLPSGRIVLGLRDGRTVPVSRGRVAALQALLGTRR